MINNSLKIIILAAGESKRILSSKSKILHTIGGKTILDHVIDNVGKLVNKNNINIVISPKLKQLKKEYKKISFSFQTNPLGTAHAVLSCKNFYSKKNQDILILYADNPFIDKEIINKMVNLKKKNNSDLVLLTVNTNKKNEYGRIVLDKEDKVKKIVEFKDATSDQKRISICNSGIMLFKSEVLKRLIKKIKPKNKKKEYYLTDIIELANENNLKVDYIKSNFLKTLGVNTKQELAIAEENFQNTLRKKFISSGVKLLDPKSVFFNHDTKIGKDVVVEPNVFFGPDVTIKNNVHIKAFSHIEGVKILDNAVIGPFARLRPGTVIGPNSHIGNFVEIKKSNIKKNSKINHLTYLGDTSVGKNVNVGAGVITCNYDGIKKNKTIIEDNVFIGSNASLVAPIKLEKSSIVGAGSVITQSVKEKALAVERNLQKTFPNYRKNRKK
ncbi:MAG: Bifunctional protein GlmU [Alphaproteobacteria bacterium MarineAlpha6_Bin4]|nr:MAG: Bifunctional protein GlmU [Alphaproteobacteria bacterium MarineAlpha6_Bin3]PPR37104.1 MAG: Bifunctional protein GlmU [Alphaproteobacteria bacterium MarineAlpha6_Bin4]|tara:strand:- start:1785 stop:3107 length:1323 start_codon:yes stop_codon:yes gene_type:complete